jgi:type II secretory pathway pseudopilin PulG
MKKLRSQHYLLLILSILALFAAVSAYVFMYNDAVKKAKEEAAMRAEMLIASDQTLGAKNTETTYKDTVINRSRLPSLLVSEADAVPFINAVEAVGPATGATISISSLSSGTDSDSSHRVVMATISIAGTWANTMLAVEMIENLPYAISVKSLNVNASLANSSTPKTGSSWTAILDISVLSLP